ncbi:MAG: hypothetical protein H0X13_15525 [Ramlibacter sp.]|nr:hypothetical protein [Ramlibacter sp.]
MLLDTILKTAMEPAFALLPPHMDTPAARVMLLAIGLQESRFMFRFQKIAGKPYQKGPARGFWQFERGGGVHGVMSHAATQDVAERICIERAVPFDSVIVHARLETDDVLAACFARLLLWADRKALPAPDASHDEAWGCYMRNWRPGKPHRETWDQFHAQARGQVFA